MNTQPNELQMSDVIGFLNRLRQSEKEAWRYADELEQERKRLHEVNQMLVESAEMALDALVVQTPVHWLDKELHEKAIQALRQALSKAKGQT